MKRTQRTIKNVTVGLFFQFTSMATGFVLRTVMLGALGITAVSINGLFTEVLAMLALAELGIGSAITYSLYKPLAEKNYLLVGQYMNLYKKAYRCICIAIIVIGASLLPFIQYIIKDVDLDLSYIRFIYSLFVIQSASTYLFSYKTSLIIVDQKRYIESTVAIITKVVSLIISIIVLNTTKNYVLYLIFVIIVGLCQNICYSIIADRMYPCLKEKSKLSKEETKNTFKNIKNMFIAKLSSKITNSTDNILISAIVSTISVGMYSNYALIINACRGIIDQFGFSVSASIGNLVATETTSRVEYILKCMTYFVFLTGIFIGACLYVVITDIVTMWLGAEYQLSEVVVFVCMVNFVLYTMREPLWQVTTLTGLFKENSIISIIACVANLVISILIGLKYGMVGVFLGTTFTFLLQISLKTYFLYTRRFNDKPRKYYLKFYGYFILAVATMIFSSWVCSMIQFENLFISIIIKLCISFAICVLVGVVPFIKTKEFNYLTQIAKNFINKKFKKG